jgi:hypothetical protein
VTPTPPGLDSVARLGRKRGRQGGSVEPCGGGRWSSCSGEVGAQPGQSAAAWDLEGTRERARGVTRLREQARG